MVIAGHTGKDYRWLKAANWRRRRDSGEGSGEFLIVGLGSISLRSEPMDETQVSQEQNPSVLKFGVLTYFDFCLSISAGLLCPLAQLV